MTLTRPLQHSDWPRIALGEYKIDRHTENAKFLNLHFKTWDIGTAEQFLD